MCSLSKIPCVGVWILGTEIKVILRMDGEPQTEKGKL